MGSLLINNNASFFQAPKLQRRMLFLLFAFSFVLTSCEPDRNEVYKVSGVLYDEDGVTPVPNHKLSIALTNFGSGQALTNSEYLDYPTEGYTDENGAFELEYQHDKKAKHMMVFSESAGRLITAGANRDHDRDLCLENLAQWSLKFQGLEQLGQKDSLLVHLSRDKVYTKKTVILNKGTFQEMILNVIEYPFEEVNSLKNMQEEWNREGTSTYYYSYAVGMSRFNKITPDSPNREYLAGKGSVTLEGFPYTTEVEVDLAQ